MQSRVSGIAIVLVCLLAVAVVGLVPTAVHAQPKAKDADAAKTELVPIPATWKRAARGSAAAKDGFAWFRCWVEIPADWRDKDLEFFLEGVDDAREAYINGVRVGGFGQFPPKFRSGLGGSQKFFVDAAHVEAGKRNSVAIRIYKEAARENFNVAAPVVFGPREAIRLEGNWEFHSGDDRKWGTAAADQANDKVVYKDVKPREEVEASLKQLQGEEGPFTVEETLKRITIPEDLAIDVVLAEPVIGQPLSMKWDERGRLWVVEYRQYPVPAGLKMVSRDKYLRSVYDKVPPAPPNHFKGKDRISIHEDTDGDGIPDRHSTFVDDLSLVSSFAIGRGGVWVLNPPYLLFYPDKNNDDVPDGDPEVHLEGFGIEDSHSIANSLRWGPDGWLYAGQGSTVTGNIKKPGTKDKPVHSMGQLIWRYHPKLRKYEIFAEGGGNTFGAEIDDKGRIYSGHNGGDTRGFHYVQGGYFRKGFGKHGELSNPYSFGYFPHIAHHKVPRFTHTFVIYQSNELPKQYHGKLFGVGPLQSHVVYSDIETLGSTFKTKDAGHVLTSRDSWVRPVDVQVGPDGGLYVADFYEQRIDHASHYQGRVTPETGRIYRLRSKTAKPAAKFDLAKRSDEKLLAGLQHHNKWFRQETLRVIGDRNDPKLARKISLQDASGQTALELLWALYQSDGLSDEKAREAIQHDDPFVRLWTVRLLCDEPQVSRPIAGALAALAGSEPNVEVRCQLACSAKRLPAADALPIVRNLLNHSEDSNDPYQPLLLWWAIESKCEVDGKQVVDLFRQEAIWSREIIKKHILERLMRRFAQAGTRKDLLICADLLNLAPTKEASTQLLAGFEKAFEGRTLTALPKELVAAISKSGGGSLSLRLRQGEDKAVNEALAILHNEKAKADQRARLAVIFGQLSDERSLRELLKLAKTAKNEQVRGAALNALTSFKNHAVADTVVGLYEKLSETNRQVAATLLASRADWALSLVDAVVDKRIAQDHVPMDAVRKLLLHQNEALQGKVTQVWGKVEGATTDQMLAKIKQLTAAIGDGSGNPYKGKVLFKQSCAKCHVLFTDGAYIGPNLTSYKRDDLPRMLLNIVNPSIEIREGFENYVVFTLDGRVLNGFISEQDNQVVVLRSADGQITTIERDDIDEMRAVKTSIMPEGLLKDLTNQQVRDLFAYLRATQPLP